MAFVNGFGGMVPEATIGVLNAMKYAGHSVVPVGGDAGSGARKIIAEGGYPGVTAAQAPVMSAVAREAAVALLEGNALPQMVYPTIPQKANADLVSGTDHFPELPDTFHTTTGYPNCFAGFTPDELLGQSPDNL